ncbi:hypothetical protein ACFL35_20495 [Candidatus Riflebacteria bacterium]
MVLIAVPAFGFFLSPAPFYKEIASEFKIPVELNTISSLQKKPRYKLDNVHFNEKGNIELAKAVLKLLKNSGAFD